MLSSESTSNAPETKGAISGEGSAGYLTEAHLLSVPGDARPVILLVIGFVLLVLIPFRQSAIVRHPDSYVRLQAKGDEIAVVAASMVPEAKDQDVALSAGVTPFFFSPLPINEANLQMLETIKGVGPHLAMEIIRTRMLHGSFHDQADLLRVRGIGPKNMTRFADQFSYR